MATGISWVDTTVIIALMAAVTLLGHKLSGTIGDRRGFFQAGGSLPWWAVSASIVATLVSSVTFVSVPANVFKDGGNLTYFQLILGLAFGKILVAMLVARPFYLSQGIHTSYEYISARLDRTTGEVSMALGLVLNIITSGVKLLTASIVLDVVTGWGITSCAGTVVAIGVLWSTLSGLKTVIWTDFILFVLFSLGAVFALLFLYFSIELPLPEMFIALDERAKTVLFDTRTDPAVRYTLWTGVIGGLALTVAQACTQGTWQRVRACRSVTDAHKAYTLSAAFYVMHLVILAVGLGLTLFYLEHDLPADLQRLLPQSPDRIFPYFIATEIPVGISGLFFAAIFAAAISTLDSTLAESADLTVRHIYERLIRPNQSEDHYLRASRWIVVLWGGVFFAVTLLFARYTQQGLLDLTFKLPNYVIGIVFATIVLARIGLGNFRSFCIGAAVATVCIYAMQASGIAFLWWCPVSGGAMLLSVWLAHKTGLVTDHPDSDNWAQKHAPDGVVRLPEANPPPA